MFPFNFGPLDNFKSCSTISIGYYPISWLISNNEYGNIVKHGFKMYGKTASLFLYAWDSMAGLSQEVLFGGFGFAGTSVPH